MKTARQLLDERMCHRCRQRKPRRRMHARRTPAGGVIYTCRSCQQGEHERKRK